MKQKIIIDCDPGIDDAIAILAALASQEDLDVLGISAVAGNVSLKHTQRNALRLVNLADQQTKVYAGCPRAMMTADKDDAVEFHGSDGVGGVNIGEVSRELEAEHAVNFIINSIRANPNEITLAVLGPMTNIAVAIVQAPDIVPLICKIVFMGGAAWCAGNTTVMAEFNFWADPHAADIVMKADVEKVMMGLDVTRQVQVLHEDLDALRGRGQVCDLAVKMLENYGYGDPFLHDPCVTSYLLAPELFAGELCAVEVECASALSLGKSVAFPKDELKGRKANCLVVNQVDSAQVLQLIWDRLARLS